MSYVVLKQQQLLEELYDLSGYDCLCNQSKYFEKLNISKKLDYLNRNLKYNLTYDKLGLSLETITELKLGISNINYKFFAVYLQHQIEKNEVKLRNVNQEIQALCSIIIEQPRLNNEINNEILLELTKHVKHLAAKINSIYRKIDYNFSENQSNLYKKEENITAEQLLNSYYRSMPAADECKRKERLFYGLLRKLQQFILEFEEINEISGKERAYLNLKINIERNFKFLSSEMNHKGITELTRLLLTKYTEREVYEKNLNHLCEEFHKLKNNYKIEQADINNWYEAEKMELIRRGKKNLEFKKNAKLIIESYLSGIMTKQQLKNTIMLTNPEINEDDIVKTLENESYITTVFGLEIWNIIKKHTNYMKKLSSFSEEAKIKKNPLIEQFNYLYNTKINYSGLKNSGLKRKKLDIQEKKLFSNQMNMTSFFEIDLNESYYKTLKLVEEMADYKILYNVSNEQLAEKFGLESKNTVTYFFETVLFPSDFIKYLLVLSVNNINYKQGGLSNENKEVVSMIKALIDRGYSRKEATYLVNGDSSFVEKVKKNGYL